MQLLDVLRRPHTTEVLRVPVAAAIALAPAAILGASLFELGLARPEMPTMDWRFYLGDTLVASPLIETAFMFPVFSLLERCRVKTLSLPAASALFWAALHALKYPAQGLIVAWPFWVFSAVALHLRAQSKNRAFLVVSAVHALFNLGMVSLEVLVWF